MYNIENKKQIIGRIKFHEQVKQSERATRQLEEAENRVLILHTGGTIGMFPDEEGKFTTKKDRFKQFLSAYPYFCDEDQTFFSDEENFTITPPTIGNKKIRYHFKQFDTLIDSTNMTIQKLNKILEMIEAHYEKYDSFIILHGTDTMAYTASALSFMIDNLKKTIIITGAQIPLGETRNDAANNLLCSLTIAGHYDIPEVLIVFDNLIMRGNRTTKTSASALRAFQSPNFKPLGKLGLKISIRWQHVFPSEQGKPTTFTKLKHQVSVLRLTPFGFQTPPSSKYVVVQSYGVGNIPTDGAFYDWVVDNSKLPEKKRTVIVNLSQAYQSVILNLYATGQAAYKLGLIPGSDMTCEAAVAKLSYLATVGYSDLKELGELMIHNYRGELTEEEERNMKNRENYIMNSLTLLEKNFRSQSVQFREILHNVVYPTLVLENPTKAAITRLQLCGYDIHYVSKESRNILHQLVKIKRPFSSGTGHEMFLNYIIQEKVNLNLIDYKGNSPMFYAIEAENYDAAEILVQSGAVLKTSQKRIFQAIKDEDLSLLNALVRFNYPFTEKNAQNRNCAFYAIISRKESVCRFLHKSTNLFNEQNQKKEDIYGYPLSYYMQEYNFSPEKMDISFQNQGQADI